MSGGISGGFPYALTARGGGELAQQSIPDVSSWLDSWDAHPPLLVQETILSLLHVLSANAPDASLTGSVTSFCSQPLVTQAVLKENKSCFKADTPKNYMLFYSRKQPKEQGAAGDATSLPAPAAHSDARRHLLAGEKGGVFCD